MIEAVERQPFSLPIKEVMGPDGSLSFLQHVRDKGYFDIDFRRSELVLVAGNYIGQIPLTPDITIHVRPKVPIANLARIIGIANEPIRCLDFFRRTYELTGEASQTLLEAMGRSLIASLRLLDAEGVFREYLHKSQTISALRGRIDVSKYIRSSLARGISTQIPCKYFELSGDTIFNRVIKRAICQIGYALSEQAPPNRGLLQELSYFADRLGIVTHDDSPDLLNRARQYLVHARLPELRHYYLDILDVCFIILEGSGVELMGQSVRNGMHSFIVSLEGAFEQYIRQVLRQSEGMKAANVPVLDGNKEGRSTLFSDNTNHEAKPDLVIGMTSAALAIADVKYKTKLSEADRYQLIAHASAYTVKKAFLITPASDRGLSGPQYAGKVGSENPIEIYYYRIDLDRDDLLEEERKFKVWAEDLLLQHEATS